MLTTLAMAGLGVVVYSFLDRYLTQRVDEDLQRSSLPIIGYVQRGFIPPDRPDERAFAPSRLLHRRCATPTGRVVQVDAGAWKATRRWRRPT